MSKKRKSGDGLVRLRKDGCWEGRYVVGYDENGLPKTKNVLAKTKTDCIEKLKILKEECGDIKSDKIKPEMKFADWLDFWYEHYAQPRLRPTTQATYESRIKDKIIPALGQIPLNQLNQNHLQQFYINMKTSGRKRLVDHYGAGLADSTIRSIHAICRAALEQAIADDLIRINPANDCKLPSKTTKEMQVLIYEEMQRFLIQAKEEGYYELFLLELATGLRRGELLALQWSDLNFATGELKIDKQVNRVNGKITVSVPKTKASIRMIILPPSIINVLKNHKENSNSGWLFPSPRKEDCPIDPSWCRKKLKIILEHAQCKQLRFHDLRHTFCTNALAHGMDVKTLSAIIGHVSAATTLDIYAHSTTAMQQKAAQNIDKGIGKVSQTSENIEQQTDPKQEKPIFQPYKGKIRKPGTGCISQINDNLWEGRYSPKWADGKRKSRNIYAQSYEECEKKLAILISEMKAELAELKSKSNFA